MSENMNDLAIPEIKLIQNVGGDIAKEQGALPGDFYCALTGEVFPGATGFDLVVTGRSHIERTYWGSDHEVQSDEPPTCSSTDGITSINGDDCKTACPFQAFTDAPGLLSAEERKGKCTPGYKVTGISLSNLMPVFIRCSGISATAARELNTLLAFHKNIRGQFFKAKFTVTSIKKKTGSGEAYAIKFGEPKLLDEPVMNEIKDLMMAMGTVVLAPVTPPAQIPQSTLPNVISTGTNNPVFSTQSSAPIAQDKHMTAGEIVESQEKDLAAAKERMEAGKRASMTTAQKEAAAKAQRELDANTSVPQSVQKLGAEVNAKIEKKPLPKMSF